MPAGRGRHAARYRWARCRHLDDGVAAGALQLGANMAAHAEAGPHELQLLGDVLAKRPEAAATCGASIGRGA